MRVPLYLLLSLLPIISPNPATADHYEADQSISINQSISDGRYGNWHEWNTNIPNRPLKRIEVTLERERGTRDTFVNLGFANSANFEPMRVYLRDDGQTTITWDTRNERPNGRPLVMKAYNGKVYLKGARLIYDDNQFESRYRDHDRDDNRASWSGWNSYNNPNYRLNSIIRDIKNEFEDIKYEVRSRHSWSKDKKLISKLDKFEDALSNFSHDCERSSYLKNDTSSRLDDLFSASREVREKLNDRGYSHYELSYRWNNIERLLNALYDETYQARRRPIYFKRW